MRVDDDQIRMLPPYGPCRLAPVTGEGQPLARLVENLLRCLAHLPLGVHEEHYVHGQLQPPGETVGLPPPIRGTLRCACIPIFTSNGRATKRLGVPLEGKALSVNG